MVEPDTTVEVQIEELSQVVYYVFTIVESGWYDIQSDGYLNATGTLYDANRTILAYRIAGGYGENFRIQRNIAAGTYYLGVNAHHTQTGTVTFTIEKHVVYSFEAQNAHWPTGSQDRARVEIPPLPTRTDYHFAGWYDNPDFTGNPVNFPYRSRTDITLYGKWSETPLQTGFNVANAFVAELDTIYHVFTDSYRSVYYVFTPTVTGTYVIESFGYTNTWVQFFSHDDGIRMALGFFHDGGSGNNFRVEMQFTAGIMYEIQLKTYYSYDIGPFTFSITQDGS